MLKDVQVDEFAAFVLHSGFIIGMEAEVRIGAAGGVRMACAL